MNDVGLCRQAKRVKLIKEDKEDRSKSTIFRSKGLNRIQRRVQLRYKVPRAVYNGSNTVITTFPLVSKQQGQFPLSQSVLSLRSLSLLLRLSPPLSFPSSYYQLPPYIILTIQILRYCI